MPATFSPLRNDTGTGLEMTLEPVHVLRGTTVNLVCDQSNSSLEMTQEPVHVLKIST